jgi:type I site-specific restriction endonuclease
MTNVVFGNYNFKQKVVNDTHHIFDVVRGKFVVLTPEEWVRQHVIHYLIIEKKYPKPLLAVEKQILLNGLRKRCDVVAYNRDAKPFLLVECKAHDVPLNNDVLMQILQYNQKLNVPFLWVSNGTENFCFDTQQGGLMLTELPAFVSAP